MTMTWVVWPKFQVPRALATSMARGFIEAESRPATRIFDGELGTMAANMSTTAPIHEIIGITGVSSETGCQCMTRPMAMAVTTRYTRPRSRMNVGLRFDFRV